MKLAFAAVALVAATSASSAPSMAFNNKIFNMVPSSATCLPAATGRVTVSTRGDTQYMHVEITHMPPGKSFEFFVIQVPKAPFGMSWYQGDITTDANGVGVNDFVGIFSKETFTVAPGVAPAPLVFPHDAATNPKTDPIQMYHLGLWFDSPAVAQAAGCPGTITPFNGPHNAGVQVLSTKNFGDANGPLRSIQ